MNPAPKRVLLPNSRVESSNGLPSVPARRTSKAKKNKRRTHYKVTAPSVNFDETTGDYSRSHRVSLKGYYKGRKIAKAASAE